MSKSPLVSVWMITYNHKPYIAQAIEGVLMQRTSFPFELVIGEDCSTDGTREVVLECQKRHPETIRVITSERNVGMQLNELRTDKACRGKYIAYCEGDDYWHHPLKLQKQVDYLESHLDVGLVYTGMDILHDETGGRIPWVPKPDDYDSQGDTFTRLITSEYGPGTPTVCARRELVESVKRANTEFSDPEIRGTTTALWLELSRITPFRLINESMATYRVLPESACHSKSWEKAVLHARFNYALRLHYIQKYRCPEGVERRIHSEWNTRLLRLAAWSSDSRLAAESLNSLKSLLIPLRSIHYVDFFCATTRLGPFVYRWIMRPYGGFRRRFVRNRS